MIQENIPYTADEIKAMVKTCEKYNKALERARVYHTGGSISDAHITEVIFPELKESEDERIKKEIVDFITSSNKYGTNERCEAWLNWLEKQGGQKPILDFKASDWYVSKVDGKIHNIYHSVDKVEPKFKVGDWIIGDEGIFKITQYENEYGYELTGTTGYVAHFISPDYVESNYHIWTIQDAKDGDVLVTTSIRNCPFIYRKTSYKNELAYYYAGIDGNGDFSEGCLKRMLYHFGSVANVAPATKEQRELLFEKMKEAGYEWDAEKKELSKQPLKIMPKFCVGQVITDDDGTWYKIKNIKCLEYYELYDACEDTTYLELCSFIDEKFRERTVCERN